MTWSQTWAMFPTYNKRGGMGPSETFWEWHIMSTNEGGADRIIRIVLGIALLAFAFMSASPYAWLGYIGIVPLLTGAIGWCPLYTMLGIRTCPMKQG